jgi:hypothetical protein
MNALARTDYAACSLSEEVVSDFIRKGAHVFDELLPEKACADLLAEVVRGRRFDESLFLEPGAVCDGGAPCGDALARLDGKLASLERATTASSTAR